MKNSYVVCVKSPSDWSEIHKLLLLDGTLEDNLPSRACECVDAKEVYDDKATYLLDDEEAEAVKQHPKVDWVELDPSIHPEADYESVPFSLPNERFNTEVKLFRGVDSITPSSSPPRGVADVDNTGSSLPGTDEVYATSPTLELDVSYFPYGGKRPVVIGIHGGGFYQGDKDTFDQGSGFKKGDYFTGLGYNYVSLNYRLVTNANLLANVSGGVVNTGAGSTLDYTLASWTDRLSTDDQLLDLAKGVKWVVNNADKWGLDANNIILFGHSAGAHLVAQLSTRKDLLDATGVDIARIKGCIIVDTSTFDLKNKLTSYSTTTDQNAWLFMNAYGLHPSINTVDFETLEQAEYAWNIRSPQGNIQNTSKPKTDYAKSFCIVTRGTAGRRDEANTFKSKITDRGIPVTFLDYEPSGGADITAGSVTYDHEGIHRVLGGTDIPDTSSAFNHISIKSMSTEIKNYLNSVVEPLADQLNRSSWHLTRLSSKDSFWTTDDLQENKDPITNAVPNAIDNQNFVGKVKEANPKFVVGETGKYVDAIVIDNGAWHGHPEFVDAAGVSQIKDIILDGPYYLDKEYFDTNSKTTTFLGRTTCTELSAKEWWINASKRSIKFSTAPTLSSGSIPSVYTRANICGSYSAYPSYASTQSSFANHGTPVASSVYGKTFGWAFEANKWNIASNIGISGLISTTKVYEILKIFVDNKPSVSGIKYPTVINSSYGLKANVANEWASGTYFYKFRGEPSGSFTSKATAPRFLKNFISESNSLYSVATMSSTHQTHGDALANTPGVVWFASAGNSNQLQVMPGDPDYNNLWSTQDPDLDTFNSSSARYVNRRGSPANFGYNSEGNYYNVISVGALSAYFNSDKKEGKDWYSNSGTGVNVFSPASGGLAAAGNTSQERYPRFDSKEFYSWLSKDAFDCEIGGTSTASPVIAGFIASRLTSFYYWTARSVRKYIEGVLQNQNLTTFNVGSGEVTTSDSTDWEVRDNLFGQEPKVVYSVVPSPLSFRANLPAVTEIDNTETPVIFSVILSSPLASEYSYQWQKSTSGASYIDIEGETSSSLTLTSFDSSVLDKYYRVAVISDGPYQKSFSSTTLLKKKPTVITISKQPVNTKIAQGKSVSLTIKAETTSSGTIAYQWQKYDPSTEEWNVVTGGNSASLNFINVKVSSDGSYRCLVSDDSSDPVFSETVSFEVIIPELKFTLEPQNFITFVGNSVQLNVAVSSTTPSTIFYQWQFSKNKTNWKNIDGAQGPSLILNDLEASQDGYYRCRAVDNISVNSPAFSAFVRVEIKPVVISISTTKLETSLIEGEELSLKVEASVNDPSQELSYSFQKKHVIGGKTLWRIVDVNSTGDFYIKKISKLQQGRYKCVISNPIASNSPATVSPIDVTVLDSFAVTNVSSSPASAIVDEEVSLTPEINILNNDLFFYYIWERQESGSSEWKLINEAQNKTFTFKATGRDYLDKFRCKITNDLGTTKYTSPAFQLNFAPFVDVTKDLQKSINFKENSQQTHTLDPEVVSTHLGTVTYVWQKSLDYSISDGVPIPASWSDIATETNKKIELTPSKILSLNSGNTDDFYFVRLKIIFGQNSTLSFSEPTRIDLKDVYNLFGDCLSKEAADNLYDTDFIDSESQHGNKYLPDRQYIDTINVDPVGPTDKCKDKNTCGISIEELFETYPIYNTQKGLYKSWGDIEFMWQLEEARNPSGVTCNLNTAETDDKWQVSQYKALYAYFPKIGSGGLSSPANATCLTERPADRVLRIEDDGYKISLYEAQELITSLAGPFDKTKWKKICHVITSVPAGLPTPEEIKERYNPYELDFFLKEWEEYNETWDEDFYQQSFDQCRNTNSILADIEKCLKEKTGPYGQSNDQWDQARIRKEFFYKVGDYAWIEGECKDTVCLYICIKNIPATQAIFEKARNFVTSVDGTVYWQRVYCVNTGMNKCLEPQRERDLPNYQLVELGSLGHYVEQPIPFFGLEGKKLCKEFETLNEYVEMVPPKVLTQEEINAIEAEEVQKAPADNTPPTSIINCPVTNLGAGETAQLTISLSEDSTNFELSDLSVSGGTLSDFAGSGKIYTVLFTPTENSTANGVIAILPNSYTDAAGNAGGTSQITLNVNTVVTQSTSDTTAPTSSISSSTSTLGVGETATLTITLSEASTNFGFNDLVASGGTLSGFTGSGTSYSVIFTPTPNSTADGVIDIPTGTYTDAAANNGIGSFITLSVNTVVNTPPSDTTPPTISISSSNSSLTVGQTATLTFTLSEDSTNFTSQDVSVTGGTLSGFSGSGASYTATFTPATNSVANGVITVASGSFTDAAGNSGTGNSITLSVNTVVTPPPDTTPPTVSISTSDNSLTTGETATLTFTLSESSTNFTSQDVSATGGTLSSFSGSGTNYSVVFTPATNSTTNGVIAVATGAFTDAAGNANTAGASITITVNTTTSSSVTNYTVTVQSVSTGYYSTGNRYFINGSQQPTLNLTEGQTYRFNQDNSSNTNHPLRFSTTSNGTHGGGVEYTQGVTKVGTAGSSGAYTEITVPIGAPTLYYYCANHSLMGGTANT